MTAMRERFKTWLISELGYWAIRLIGRTIRWQVEGRENLDAIEKEGKPVIYAFWHGRIVLAAYYFRKSAIVVMTSQNRDGEYIARVIRRFGYGTARGSSSRGGRRALLEMVDQLELQKNIGFAIDGPRGPRYVAKQGAVWIASRTGCPVFPFHLSPEKSWVLSSWDRFHIPKPFCRALVLMGPGIHVRQGATANEVEAAQKELQRSLDQLRERGDSYWTESGPA